MQVIDINMNSHLGTFSLSLLILKYRLILQRSQLRLFSSNSGQSGLDAVSISVSSAYIFISQESCTGIPKENKHKALVELCVVGLSERRAKCFENL